MVPPPHGLDKPPIHMSSIQFLILRPEFSLCQEAQEKIPLKTRSSGGTETGTGNPQDGVGPTEDQAQGPCGDSLWMILAMVAVLYFLMIRPQQKQEKARKALIAAVVKATRSSPTAACTAPSPTSARTRSPCASTRTSS